MISRSSALSVTGKYAKTLATVIVIDKIYYSITAGFAIMGYDETLPKLLATISSYYEYRGLSYSIGGDTNASTIPNFIKHYQENVTGYSTGKHLGEYCNGKKH